MQTPTCCPKKELEQGSLDAGRPAHTATCSSAPRLPGFHLVQPGLEALAHPPQHAGEVRQFRSNGLTSLLKSSSALCKQHGSNGRLRQGCNSASVFASPNPDARQIPEGREQLGSGKGLQVLDSSVIAEALALLGAQVISKHDVLEPDAQSTTLPPSHALATRESSCNSKESLRALPFSRLRTKFRIACFPSTHCTLECHTILPPPSCGMDYTSAALYMPTSL